MKAGAMFVLGLAAGTTMGLTIAVLLIGAALGDRRQRAPKFDPTPATSLAESRARYLHPSHHHHYTTHRRHHLAPNYVAPVLELDRYRDN